MRALIALPILLTGCFAEPKYDYSGFSIYKYFPLDGSERSWKFYNTMDTVDWLLEANMVVPHDRRGGTNVATIEYSQTEPYRLLYSIQWSSDSSDGIRIHGYRIESDFDWVPADTGEEAGDTGASTTVTGDWVDFSPPIGIAKHQLSPDDDVTTNTGGATFKSTFEEVERCPNNWASETWDCLRFVVESDGSDVPPFLGTWWLATDWGPSWFQPPGLEQPWILTEATWTKD